MESGTAGPGTGNESTTLQSGLPWRGPGPGRPDLPLPPAPMAPFLGTRPRKRWRYIGFYGEDVMLCMVALSVGPFRQCFWSLWDRLEGRVIDNTQMVPIRPEVTIDSDYARLSAGSVKALIRLGDSTPIETVCPSGGSWVWTRKRAGLPMSGRIQADGRVWEVEGFGVDDETAGYHARHTAWLWSAGVGTSTDGRSLAWNLVSGVNDPDTGSERTIWIDGEPAETGPVLFHDLDGLRTGDGSDLEFEFRDGAERRRDDELGIVRTNYLHRFGTFSGSLDGIELAEGRGVMEECRALW